MIIVEGHARLREGEIERLAPQLRAMVTATRAEPGCVSYAYGIDLLEPNVLRVAELWADEAALTAHFATPHMAAFQAALAGAAIEGMSVKAYSATFVRTLMGE